MLLSPCDFGIKHVFEKVVLAQKKVPLKNKTQALKVVPLCYVAQQLATNYLGGSKFMHQGPLKDLSFHDLYRHI